jgi:tetratricopeptide (TPR) repeat protein
MNTLKKLFWFSLIFSLFTSGALMLIPLTSSAKEQGHHRVETSTVLPSVQEQGGNSPSVKAIAGLQSNQLTAPSIIYAPRDVIDMTRLVLEASRDQTSHLAHYIERGTTVIVILFSVLAACGAVFGLKNLHEIEARARLVSTKIEAELKETSDKLRLSIGDLSSSFTREIDEQTELLAARAEIGTSLVNSSNIDIRMLRNAEKRIEAVLKLNDYKVSTRGGIRGFADLAFAKKRLGDHEGALATAILGLEAAESIAPKAQDALELLSYNVACYSSLLNKSNACEWLEKAIKLNPQFKVNAQADADFDKIKNLSRFKELVS